jgi:hypothetical protein
MDAFALIADVEPVVAGQSGRRALDHPAMATERVRILENQLMNSPKISMSQWREHEVIIEQRGGEERL